MNKIAQKPLSIMIVFAILLSLSITFNLTAYAETAPFFNLETGTWSSGDDESNKCTWDGTVLTVKNDANIGIAGTVSDGRRVEVEANATNVNIILNNMSISGKDVNQFPSSFKSPLLINNGADVNIKIVGNNILKANSRFAGLQVPEGASVTIFGNGSLTATGGGSGAGIGGGSGQGAGNITINGGTIYADVTKGSSPSAAGIGGGGGRGGFGGNIAINGGMVAAMEGFSATGIGNGRDYMGTKETTLTMNGNAIVFATSINDNSPKEQGILFVGEYDYYGEPQRYNGILYGGVTLEKDMNISTNLTLSINSATLTVEAGVSLINEGTIFLGKDGSIISGNGYGSFINNGILYNSGTDEENNVFDVTSGLIKIEKGTAEETIKVKYNGGIKDNVPKDNQITIIGDYYGNSDGIFVDSGVTANIKLSNVNIYLSEYKCCALRINDANVFLELIGNNILSSGSFSAGIDVPVGSSVAIYGSGSLDATGQSDAGIGTGGNVTIDSGTIVARSRNNGAGICSTNGTVTVSGGTVTAIGGDGSPTGAGIGGDAHSGAGNVIITGGVVTAIGGYDARGIGSGGFNNFGGTLTMNGNAIVSASSVNADVNGKNGILFNGNTGVMYGNVILEQDLIIPHDKTLALYSGTLTIDEDVTLTNNGTIVTRESAAIIHDQEGYGTLACDGIIKNVISNISGLTKPIPGNIPVTTIMETSQYTGTVLWFPNHSTFQEGVNYIAEVTLTAKQDFDFINIPENYFLAAGADSVSNKAGSNIITAVFSSTNAFKNIFDISDGIISIEKGTIVDTIKVIQNGVLIEDNIPQETQIVITGNYSYSGGNGVYVASDVTADIKLSNISINLSESNQRAFNIDGANVTLTLHGENAFRSGWGASGLEVQENSKLIIDGSGSLLAVGGDHAAGIGAWESGIIIINGGTINARSGSFNAGINAGAKGNLEINGGIVTASGGAFSSGIGGTFTMNGNAVVFASSVNDDAPKTKGILFIGSNGTVYGEVVLDDNVTVPSNLTLILPNNAVLTIPKGKKLTSNGITINDGIIINNGVFVQNGTTTNNGLIVNDRKVSVTFDTIGNAVIMIAFYDGSKLIDTKMKSITISGMLNDVEIPVRTTVIKAMLWDRLNIMQPLYNVKAVKTDSNGEWTTKS